MDMDESTWKKLRLEVGRVYATVSAAEAINRVMKIQINGVVYSIRVVEDVFRFCGFKLISDGKGHVSEESSPSTGVSDSMANCNFDGSDLGDGG